MRGGERLAHIKGELERILKPYVLGLQRCAMEGASYGSVHREFDLGEASGVVRAYLYTVTHREALIVTPALLKKFATGNGLATKEDVLHAVQTIYGHDFEVRDDVADAFVLARISRAHASPKILTRRCELEVLRTLATPAKSRPKPKTAKSL